MPTDADVLKDATDLFTESRTGSSLVREWAEEDIRFARLGDQWKIGEVDIAAERRKEGRPALTINRMPSFVRQVVNDARQNKPSTKVSPVDGGADEDTAQIFDGIIRKIERNSAADVAYDTAIDSAVTNGFGFWRLGIDWAHPMSFDKEIRIHRVANPLSVFWDVHTSEVDASDWRYAFVVDSLPKREFERRWPDAAPTGFDSDSDYTINDAEGGREGNQIMFAEFWTCEPEPEEIVLLSNGEVYRASKLPDMARRVLSAGGIAPDLIGDDEAIQLAMASTGVTEARRRISEFKTVRRRLVSGHDVLPTDDEDDVWPGEQIPIVPVWGEEVISRGRRYVRSLIRDAQDPQRMFNFWRSATTELVALAPRAPWVGPEGFIPKGHEQKWESANTRSWAYLEYNPNLQPPQRQPFASVPAGAIQEALNAADDMKAIIGVYDAALGARSNETSGRAIMARQRESDTGTFHFIDNLNRAIRSSGQCLVDAVPSVYGARQVVRILGEDQKERVARLVQQGQLRAAA